MSPISVVLLLVFVLLPLLISFVFAYFLVPLVSSQTRGKVKPKSDWLTTTGILDSHVRLEKKRLYYLRRSSTNLEVPSYYADIYATYLVTGQSYIVRPPVSFFDEASSTFRNKAEELVAKYPSGMQVAVRYDPRNPQRAIILMETIRLNSL